MKKDIVLAILLMLATTIPIFSLELSKGSHHLNRVLSEGNDNEERFPVVIVLKDQFDTDLLYSTVKDLPKSSRRNITMSTLKAHSEKTQREIRSFLEKLESEGEVERLKFFWISNVIGLNATAGALALIEQRDDVKLIKHDPLVDVLIKPEHSEELIEPMRDGAEREIVWNLDHMGVPEIWEQGFFGQDVLVGVFDTGINHNHHDIRDRMWVHEDYPNHGWNFTNDSDDTMDRYDHGTHCAGSVAGDGTSGRQTGIAPQATVMTLKIYTDGGHSQEVFVWDAIEFALEHEVDVFSMSLGWYQTMDVARDVWRDVMSNLLSAGVPALLAAGNEASDSDKPIPYNIRTPACNPPPWLHPDQTEIGGVTAVICIGATNSSDGIASFSSRGPVTWQTIDPFFDYPYNPGIGLIRPDVTAPGVGIVSLSHSNVTGYSVKGGTSMATPNAAGVVTLMVSKNKEITPEEIGRILEETAVPQTETKSNSYGSGRIDALAAVNAVIRPTTYAPSPTSGEINVDLATSLRWRDGGLAQGFKISLGTDNPPSNILSDVETLYTSYYLETELAENTEYFWRVDSINPSGVAEGAVWSFTTGLAVSEDFETGDLSAYEWQFATSGTNAQNWFVTGEDAYRGEFSARSGQIGNNSSTRISVRLEILEEGVISFYRKVSSELNYDLLRFYIDNAIVGEWSGELDWEKVTFPVTPGYRNFRWEYRKDPLNSAGQDAAWIDEIVFPPHPAPPVIYVPHSMSASVDYEQITVDWDIELNEDVNPVLFTLLGFDVYKGLTMEDEFEKVNEELIEELYYSEIFTDAGDFSYYVRAIYRKMGQIVESIDSEIIEITIFPPLDPPSFDPPGGDYQNEVVVSLETVESGAEIYYTLDGSEPNLESEYYTEPILIDESLIVRARAYKNGYLTGEIGVAEYTIVYTSVEDELQPSIMTLKLYPNPIRRFTSHSRSNTGLNIEYYLPEPIDNVRVSIYNIKGQLIRSYSELSGREGNNHLYWDLTDKEGREIGSGFYLIRFSDDQQTKNRKVLIIN